jgi:DegV family protein with EDD domain
MPYYIHGVEYFPDNSEEDREIYTYMREGGMPKTYSLPPAHYVRIIEHIFEQGLDIVWVGLSDRMTGTYNSLHLAYQELKEKYPDRTLHIINTKAVTAPMWLIAERISIAAQFMSVEELLNYADELISKVKFYFFPENLEHFRRGGRVSNASAFFGNFFSVRPLMTINENGELVVMKKVKGKRKILNELVEYFTNEVDTNKLDYVYVTHCDNLKLVEGLEEAFRDKYQVAPQFRVKCVNPTSGAHCGPDAVGIAFIAQ